MIEELKKNIENERRIVSEINSILSKIPKDEKDFYSKSIQALANQIKIINNSIPSLIESISPIKQLSQKENKEVVKISYDSQSKEKMLVTINKKDKEDFTKELQISSSGLQKIRKLKSTNEAVMVYKPSELAKVSSFFFSKISEKLSPQFSGLSDDLKKANIRFLTSTYLSIAIFVSLLCLILGALAVAAVAALSNLGISILYLIWIPFLAAITSFTLFYIYPSAQKKSVQGKIQQELPFATIHMAAIASSNVEPTKIFKIIASSSEYPTISTEIKKVINQTDIYGYDLVTALKNSAKQTSSQKLSEMFTGLATNISSGGNLKNYLEKKADNLLVDYRLERQSYNELAGTFMDVYISTLITAPLILMVMFIVMNISGLGIGLSFNTILIITMAGIVLVNIIFMIVLEIKQPKT